MEIKDSLIHCLKQIDVIITSQNENDDLRLLGMDSLQIVLLMSQIEKHFNIKLDLKNFHEEDFYFLKSLELLVQSYLNKN